MSRKKLLWIGVLIIAIIGIVVAIIVMNNASQSQKDAANNDTKNLAGADRTAPANETQQNTSNGEYTKMELADGTLYTNTGKKETADMVIGTNYFDTTITDMYYNPANYQDKKIEIEGFYLTNGDGTPYTFVGRYSKNTLCPTCPSGYSVMEYQLDGKIDETFKQEDTWLKIVGELEEGYDEVYGEYYYLKVLNLQVMKQKGEMEVVN